MPLAAVPLSAQPSLLLSKCLSYKVCVLRMLRLYFLKIFVTFRVPCSTLNMGSRDEVAKAVAARYKIKGAKGNFKLVVSLTKNG